jgi:hypothetical protein
MGKIRLTDIDDLLDELHQPSAKMRNKSGKMPKNKLRDKYKKRQKKLKGR